MSLRLSITAYILLGALTTAIGQVQPDTLIRNISETSSQYEKRVTQLSNKYHSQIDSLTTKITALPKTVVGQGERALSKYNSKADTAIATLEKIPTKYIKHVDHKIDKYSNRLTTKTEKTLTKLSRWEDKVHALLNKVNPEAAERLFGNNQLTFKGALEKVKEGKAIVTKAKFQYDEYRDQLTTSLKYLQEQKDKVSASASKQISDTKAKLDELEQTVSNTEAIEVFVKQRKKQLINEATKYLGKSKYLTKISKESYYYIETLRNYKEIFSDPKKVEETALTILNKIPAFKNFMQKNSALASLFRFQGSGIDINDPAFQASIAGLQTNAQINTLIQQQISTGGPNAAQIVQQNMEVAKAQIQTLKNKINKAGGSSEEEMPDFKPNGQKSKTFFQRLEYGTNFQTSKGSSFLPARADIGLSLGYKINNKSVVGVGASYKVGMGSIQHIRISHEGIGLRSFIDWKLKRQFFVSGGFEMNHNAQFKNIAHLKNSNTWQQSGLIGLSKKYKLNKKVKGNMQLMYDFLSQQHYPMTQPIIFRTGYTF